MKPVIVDADTGNELWRASDCADHCGITPASWRAYVATGRAPASAADLGQRMPLWEAVAVKHWQASRPGSPVPNHPTGREH